MIDASSTSSATSASSAPGFHRGNGPAAPPVTLTALRTALATGRKGGVARALALLEQAPDSSEVLMLLEAAWQDPAGAAAQVIGLTGPPGVGKSTLTGALIAALRQQGQRVAVIAVDPSSRRSGGALLGDRVRLATDPEDSGVFVRSMAARDRLGGLAELTVSAMVLLRALFDVVLIETVGVGQSETDVAGTADTVVFCVQPGSGDSLQFMKAGIVEIPHVVAVTKADLGAPAQRALADVRSALGIGGPAPGGGWSIPVLAVSASRKEGLEALLAALAAHAAHLRQKENPQDRFCRLHRQRSQQAALWLDEALQDRFGREGLRLLARQRSAARAGAECSAMTGDEVTEDAMTQPSPFTRLAAETGWLQRLWQRALAGEVACQQPDDAANPERANAG